MKLKLFILLLTLSLSTKGNTQTVKFTNGNWFNGTSFVLRTVYSVDGILKFTAPAKIDSEIDLKGQFVIPPFGEAHNHNVRKYSKFKSLNDNYLRAGIYYVKNPNCLSETKGELIGSKLINEKNSIDAVFANGWFYRG